MNIWVVDDDPAICSMLKMLLSTKGYQVETYPDPTATPIVQHQQSANSPSPPCADVMLIDYSMPNMNGLDFLKFMDKHGYSTVKANQAIITAYGTNELWRELDQRGVKYFKKPFRFPDLVTWLEGCADRVDEGRGGQCLS